MAVVAKRLHIEPELIVAGRNGGGRSALNARAICVYVATRRGYRPTEFGRRLGMTSPSPTFAQWVSRVDDDEALRAVAEMCVAACDGESWRRDKSEAQAGGGE